MFTGVGVGVGDVNGDGIPDLVITCNVITYIYWGITDYPYFTKTNRALMAMDNSWGNISNNGFGENCTHCANFAFNATIVDVNGDKQNDIIISTSEHTDNPIFPTHQRILINQGKGRFNDNNILVLPDYKLPYNETHDYIPDDINGDGKIDLIGLGSLGTDTWDIFVYMQQADGTFKIDYDIVKFSNTNRSKWKPRLIYADFNNDGKKDISYVDCDLGMTQLNTKSVFIRSGNQFIEQNFFDVDKYAYSILKK